MEGEALTRGGLCVHEMDKAQKSAEVIVLCRNEPTRVIKKVGGLTKQRKD
jgi:hypothetical protein